MFNRVATYLAQCQLPSVPLTESTELATLHTPPTAEETAQLVEYLRRFGVKPVIVGSVAIFHHLKVAPHKFRPTGDLDIFVDKNLPVPPPGWRVDRESVGVTSWISPSNGYVDFMPKSFEFPSGTKNPSKLDVDAAATPEFPVGQPVDLIKMKLNSYRAKDMSDAVELCRAIGGVPSDSKLGRLTPTQRENLVMLRQWVDHFTGE